MIKYFFWPMNGILTGRITPDQSGPESNGNKGSTQHSPISKTGASPSDKV